MAAIVTNKHRVYAAQKFLAGLNDSLSENNVYLFIAKCLPWTSADETGADDNTPPVPKDTVAGHIKVWQDMLHLKRVSASNCSLMIRRYNWIKGVVYQEYTHEIDLFDPALGLRPFYVLTDENNVYKCLFNNNNGPSWIKPTGKSTNIIATGDGYLWKFMYDISTATAQKFLDDAWVPVKTITANDGSKQYDVQRAAIPGSLEVIKVMDGGFGYVTAPAITIYGDGENATATCDINNGKITKVNITNRGRGYSYANVVAAAGQVLSVNVIDGGFGYVSAPTVTLLGGGGTGALATCTILNGKIYSVIVTNPGSGYTSPPTVVFSTGPAVATSIVSGGSVLKAIIAPPGGHGSDAVSELGGFNVLMGASLAYDEGGFTVVNDFRTAGFLLNPHKWNSTTIGSASTYTQSYNVKFDITTGASFEPDEKIIGQTSGCVGYTLDYDSDNRILRIVNLKGTIHPGETFANEGATKTGHIESMSGNAIASGIGTLILDPSDRTPTNGYTGQTIRITSGTGVGQQRIIQGNTYSGAVQTVTVDKNWTVPPDYSSYYSISSIQYPALEPNTGYLLYVENRRPIMRASDQLDDCKVVIDF